MFIDFYGERKGRRERGKEIDVRKKTSIDCLPNAPNWASNTQPRYVPRPGVEPTALWCLG